VHLAVGQMRSTSTALGKKDEKGMEKETKSTLFL